MDRNPTRRSFLRSTAASSAAVVGGFAGCIESTLTEQPPAPETRQFLRLQDLKAPLENDTSFEVYRPKAFADAEALSRSVVPITEASRDLASLDEYFEVDLYVRNAHYHVLRGAINAQQIRQTIESAEGSDVKLYNGFMLGTYRYSPIAFDDSRLILEEALPGPSRGLEPLVDKIVGDVELTAGTATFDGLLSAVNTSYLSIVRFDYLKAERYFEGDITVESVGLYVEPAGSEVRCVSVMECPSPVVDSPESLRRRYAATHADVPYFEYDQPTISVDESQIIFEETKSSEQVFG